MTKKIQEVNLLEKKKKKNFRKWNIPKLRLDCPENRGSLQLDVFSWVPCIIYSVRNLINFALKLGLTVLFTYLKIISL